MKNIQLGILTIGQSPRSDVLPEMALLLGENVDVLEAGALDGLDASAIAALAPEAGGQVLVSRLRDGGWARMGEEKILPLIQEKIAYLESKGAALILLLCTGAFPDGFVSRVPLLYPQKIIYGVAPAFSANGHLGIVNPDPAQAEGAETRWTQIAAKVTTVGFNPYQPGEIEAAAKKLRESGADLVVLDCMGYTKGMQQEFARATGLPVLLPRTAVARLAAELLSGFAPQA